MPTSKSDLAYGEATRALLDRAANSPNGISLQVTSRKHAFQIRQRLYACRVREQAVLKKTYQREVPSPWDELTIRLVEEPAGVFLRIERSDSILTSILEVKDL
jgi:hypothetical protein